MAKIAVLGSGGFGTSLAVMTDKFGHEVVVWSAFADEIEAIRRDGEHKKLLPGVKVNESIKLTTDLKDIAGADIVLFGIPTAFLRKVARQAAAYITPQMIVVNTGKGLENGTHKRMSEVLEEELPDNKIVILTGPSHAEEVALGTPTTVCVSSKHSEAAQYVQEQLSNRTMRIYLNDDIIGCELGGALKNPIALCAGICDGMGFGDNTIAALMTRGIAEITRLGVAMGAKTETFGGLTGIGDLIVTCTSMHSRNRRAGMLIGKGVAPDEAVRQIGTVEGYVCCKVAKSLAVKEGVEMPITEQLYAVLYEGKEVAQALKDLMGRPKRNENEAVWLKIAK